MNPDANGGISPPTARPGEPVHWLVRPRTVRGLWIGFSLILIALVLSDFLVHGHPGFGIDGTFGFYAWYGLGTCVAMVLVAKGLGLSLKRPDTYYEGEGRGASEAGAPGAAESATAGRGARGAPPATVAEAAGTAQGVRTAVTGDSAGAAETSGKGGPGG